MDPTRPVTFQTITTETISINRKRDRTTDSSTTPETDPKRRKTEETKHSHKLANALKLFERKMAEVDYDTKPFRRIVARKIPKLIRRLLKEDDIAKASDLLEAYAHFLGPKIAKKLQRTLSSLLDQTDTIRNDAIRAFVATLDAYAHADSDSSDSDDSDSSDNSDNVFVSTRLGQDGSTYNVSVAGLGNIFAGDDVSVTGRGNIVATGPGSSVSVVGGGSSYKVVTRDGKTVLSSTTRDPNGRVTYNIVKTGGRIPAVSSVSGRANTVTFNGRTYTGSSIILDGQGTAIVDGKLVQ